MSSTPSAGTCTHSFPTTRLTSTSCNFLPREFKHFADLQQTSLSCFTEPTTFIITWAQAAWWIPGSWRKWRFTCQSTVLPQTENSFDLIFCWEHCDAPSWIRFGRWANSCSAGFSPLYLQEREANADRSQFCHSVRENFMSSSSQVTKSTGKPVTLFSSKNRSNQGMFPDREDFSSGHQRVLGNNEPLFRFSNPEHSVKSFFWRTQRLNACRSKIWSAKTEQIISTLVRDLQRQLDSNRLEIYCTNQGYEESRREQATLHDELAQRERVLRDTRIRNIHEMEELKRAQEMRVDDFSRQELVESQDAMHELTSQIQELQERVNYVNDSREFQDVELALASSFHSHDTHLNFLRLPSSRDWTLRRLSTEESRLSGWTHHLYTKQTDSARTHIQQVHEFSMAWQGRPQQGWAVTQGNIRERVDEVCTGVDRFTSLDMLHDVRSQCSSTEQTATKLRSIRSMPRPTGVDMSGAVSWNAANRKMSGTHPNLPETTAFASSEWPFTSGAAQPTPYSVHSPHSRPRD